MMLFLHRPYAFLLQLCRRFGLKRAEASRKMQCFNAFLVQSEVQFQTKRYRRGWSMEEA